MGDYASVYRRSLRDPEGFWGEAARALHWHRPWDRVLDEHAGPGARWFPGGEINTCFNALDRHVEAGQGARTALIYDSPVTGRQRSYAYAELRDIVARVAGMLRANGVEAGVRHGDDEVRAQLVQRMREHIGPVAAFKLVAVVGRLPKTRSGKILRGTMVRIADGSEWKLPATIDDPAILDEIAESLRGLGLGTSS